MTNDNLDHNLDNSNNRATKVNFIINSAATINIISNIKYL